MDAWHCLVSWRQDSLETKQAWQKAMHPSHVSSEKPEEPTVSFQGHTNLVILPFPCYGWLSCRARVLCQSDCVLPLYDMLSKDASAHLEDKLPAGAWKTSRGLTPTPPATCPDPPPTMLLLLVAPATLAPLLCLKLHPPISALSTPFIALFPQTLSDILHIYLSHLFSFSQYWNIWSMKTGSQGFILFIYLGWSTTSRAVSGRHRSLTIIFGMNAWNHGPSLAAYCFVPWSHLVSPEGNKETLSGKNLQLVMHRCLRDVKSHKRGHFRSTASTD